MHQNKIFICSGAADGNRTHLSLADNELPSQRATTAYMVLLEGVEPSLYNLSNCCVYRLRHKSIYWYCRRVSIPLLHLERVAS